MRRYDKGARVGQMLQRLEPLMLNHALRCGDALQSASHFQYWPPPSLKGILGNLQRMWEAADPPTEVGKKLESDPSWTGFVIAIAATESASWATI